MGTVERVELVGKLPVFVDGSLQGGHDGIDGGLALALAPGNEGTSATRIDRCLPRCSSHSEQPTDRQGQGADRRRDSAVDLCGGCREYQHIA